MEAITIITAITCCVISGKSINLSDLRMLFMAIKHYFCHLLIFSPPPPPQLPWIGVRAMGGVCKIQPEIDGWVDCYDLDPEENFILKAFHLASSLCLALWVRGYKGHSQGPFQSEGRGGRRREGSCLLCLECTRCPVTSPSGDRVSEEPGTLSASLCKAGHLVEGCSCLSSLGGGAQWQWRPIAHRKNTRVLYVAARPHQPG